MAGIRTGAADDVLGCVDLWIRALTWRDGRAPADGTEARTAGKFDHPALRFAVVGDSARPTAFALANRLSESSANSGERQAPSAAEIAYIELLAVDPAATAKGLGRELLLDAMRVSVATGCTAAMLHVRIDNHRAIRLYESEGFTTVGEPHEHELAGAPMIEMRAPLDL